MGTSVARVRYQALMLGGAMAGLGGAYLSLCQAKMFADDLVAGRGFIAVALVSLLLLRGGRLYRSRPWLWVVLLAMPFPFIANTAGWLTAELGRQPWLIYGVMRTADGPSMQVSSGNTMFTLLGFMGLYMVLGILFLFLAYREIEHGPEPVGVSEPIHGPERMLY